MHFNRDFVTVYEKAVESYQSISSGTGIATHSALDHRNVLATFLRNGRFDLTAFRDATLPRSYAAAMRETLTSHTHEVLLDGQKALFSITNWLGGQYYLTADEVYKFGEKVIIQESKNCTGMKLPTTDDIKDGLFKLILFANMDELTFAGEPVSFDVRLKITGGFTGELHLPTNELSVAEFCDRNRLRLRLRTQLIHLNEEATVNSKLNVMFVGRNAS